MNIQHFIMIVHNWNKTVISELRHLLNISTALLFLVLELLVLHLSLREIQLPIARLILTKMYLIREVIAKQRIVNLIRLLIIFLKVILLLILGNYALGDCPEYCGTGSCCQDKYTSRECTNNIGCSSNFCCAAETNPLKFRKNIMQT